MVIAPGSLPGRQANTMHTMKMTQALIDLGHQVLLLVPKYPMKNVPDLEPVNWVGLAHFYGLHTEFKIEWLAVNPRLRRYDFGLRAFWRARREGFDLVYTRLPQAAAMSSVGGIPTIFEIHDLPKGTGAPWLLRLFLRGRGAKHLITISKALAVDLENFYRMPRKGGFLKIIPDGVDLERYADLPTPLEARKILMTSTARQPFLSGNSFLVDRFTVGYTGHLYPGRGIDLILCMAARLPEVNFLVAGGMPEDIEMVKREVFRLGLHNVYLTGFIPNAEIPLYQAACEVLLMPYQYSVAASSGGDISRYLSPMKLFEYLACGRAICSSDLPVLREVLSEETAVLIKPNDSEAWITAIQRLRQRPDLLERLARNAREEARRHSWENRARRMLAGIGQD